MSRETRYPLPPTMRIFERGWLSANNILFIDDDETAVVDTGYLLHAPQTLALLGHALGGRPLDRQQNEGKRKGRQAFHGPQPIPDV